MKEFIELFRYTFFQNALLASLLMSLLASMVGTYIVARKVVFISGGITHASFGGIGLAYFLGINPFIGAALFAVATGTSIEWISDKGKIREDSSIAILWSLGMALGIIFVFITPGYTPNLMSFLFGSILSVGFSDLIVMTVATAVCAILFTVWYRPILYTAFDPQFAQITGINTRFFRYLMSVVMALAIVISIRAMGIILVLSLFTIPQTTAMLLTKQFKKIIYLSVVFGFSGSFFGLFMAHSLNIPSGASIIFLLTLQYLVLKLYFILGKEKRASQKRSVSHS